MAKRKREQEAIVADSLSSKKTAITPKSNGYHGSQDPISLQVVTGSYDRILHGIIATIPRLGSDLDKIHFQDNFLFNAHSSAIRCLAISPLSSKDSPRTEKIVLATGGTDEKVNLYSISTCLPDSPSLPIVSSVTSVENPKNKELGSLLHHESSVNVLYFPTKSKLITASDDNTIAISRTRDWTLLSKIKAPVPKTLGRPSGDTAPLGGAPSGINDFAVHPSMKLMISVGKGERCMRLWNLVTGKKASVLNFEKELLQAAGEGKRSKGEGQKVMWNSAGDEFAIVFEKGVAVFGMDSEVKCIVVPVPATKVHQIAYTTYQGLDTHQELLLISTEDGRLLFYKTENQETTTADNAQSRKLPTLQCRGQLGGRVSGIDGRIKDFQIISTDESDLVSKLIVTAGSDGNVRVWQISDEEIASISSTVPLDAHTDSMNGSAEERSSNARQVGTLLGKYNTNNRITCLKAFQLYRNSGSTNGMNLSTKLSEDKEEGLAEIDGGENRAEDKETEEEDEEEAFQGFE